MNSPVPSLPIFPTPDLPSSHRKFSFNRMFAVSGRIFKQFRRDKRTFAMIIIMPILFMFVFGITLSGDIKNVPISIEMADEGFIHPSTLEEINFGEEIYTTLSTDDRVDISNASYHEGRRLVDSCEITACLYFAPNFTTTMVETGNATILIYIDGTKPQIKGAVYNAIVDALQAELEGRGIQFDEELAFGGMEFSGLDVAIPGVMGYILTFLILLLSVLTVIREDIGKTKLRLYMAPLTFTERIFGYAIALSVLAMLETAFVLGIAIFIFGTVVQGSLALLFAAGFLYGMSHIFLAFVLSNFAKNEFQSVQLAVLVAIPSLAFSGMMIPTASLPPIIASISKFIPLTYGITIFEGIMLRGWGFRELWFEFALITGLTVVFFILALLSSSDRSKE
ncbi:MAG: ABC transporter permease [Promethearchaeota archaeon]|nr:MAG: ABC transporter permease [Candidatus Lokiarchaeota archaeon]